MSNFSEMHSLVVHKRDRVNRRFKLKNELSPMQGDFSSRMC